MNSKPLPAIDYQKIELDGVSYVILRKSIFAELCLAAGVPEAGNADKEAHSLPDSLEAGIDLDRASMAEKIKRRRQSAGLSQAELARRAGIRPETLNRIERGRTTPDFSTVRKLVVAMNAAERESVAINITQSKGGSSHENDQ